MNRDFNTFKKMVLEQFEKQEHIDPPTNHELIKHWTMYITTKTLERDVMKEKLKNSQETKRRGSFWNEIQ